MLLDVVVIQIISWVVCGELLLKYAQTPITYYPILGSICYIYGPHSVGYNSEGEFVKIFNINA